MVIHGESEAFRIASESPAGAAQILDDACDLFTQIRK